MQSSDKILYLKCHESSSCRSKLAGVLRYARFRGWRVEVLHVDEIGCAPVRALKTWNCRGLIMDAVREEVSLRRADFKGVPCVFLDCGPKAPIPGAPVVVHDSRATTLMAIGELERIRVSHFAFVCWPQPVKSWMIARREVFVSSMREKGRSFSIYDGPGGLFSQEEFRRGVKKWVAKLPGRTGVFAANDEIAAQILSVCAELGRKVPDDIAVIGVDNDAVICTNAVPELSSVQVDFERAGYCAAEILDGLVSRLPSAVSRQATFGPLGVIRRKSTWVPGRSNAHVTQAVQFIRERACEGISVLDVVRKIGGSRRAAEVAFHDVTGHSILEEIRLVRFERLCSYLRRPEIKIDFAAAQCGYTSVESLRVLFRKHMGMTMSEWRARENLKPQTHKGGRK